jgi:hypothetical protein
MLLLPEPVVLYWCLTTALCLGVCLHSQLVVRVLKQLHEQHHSISRSMTAFTDFGQLNYRRPHLLGSFAHLSYPSFWLLGGGAYNIQSPYSIRLID